MTKKGKGRMIASVDDFPVVHEVGGFVTPTLAAEMLQLKLNAIYYLIRVGRLKGIRLGDKMWLVRRSSVERYSKERSGGGGGNAD